MVEFLPISFGRKKAEKVKTKQEQAAQETKTEYVVSKNPDRVVAATGVVAGTSGMIGGTVLGGLVGVSKLPGEYMKVIAGQDYAKIVTDSFAEFKNAIEHSPELKNLVNTIKNTDSPAVAEEILHIANTMSDRLHTAFANDPNASAVIDKVIDPIVNGVSVKKNLRNYGSGLRGKIDSPIGQGILKILGFNKKTSKIVKGVTGNVAEGFAQAVVNIKNFTPEEKIAWKEVATQIFAEFEHNPKIKVSKDAIKAVTGMTKNTDWFTKPFKGMQNNILDGIKNLDKGLGNAPIKTVGKWAAIGAAACSVLSLLGWGIFKGTLFKKEKESVTN